MRKNRWWHVNVIERFVHRIHVGQEISSAAGDPVFAQPSYCKCIAFLIRHLSIQRCFFSQSDHFSFLGTATDLRTMKSRTTFYTALTRLLCVDLGEDEEQFEQYMAPLSSKLDRGYSMGQEWLCLLSGAFNELSKMCAMADSALLNQEEAKVS